MQATQGAQAYGADCARCHGKALQGAEGPPLTGMHFDVNWRGQPVKALIDYIRETVPTDRPGTMRIGDVVVLVAHILKSNGVASGAQALAADPPATAVMPPK
jgi:mono/diheme cytochrome c family protein